MIILLKTINKTDRTMVTRIQSPFVTAHTVLTDEDMEYRFLVNIHTNQSNTNQFKQMPLWP